MNYWNSHRTLPWLSNWGRHVFTPGSSSATFDR
jgi:hypothetical protein